jgi:hypothetical protein
MILYTTMPQEVVFPAANDVFENQSVITYKGQPVMVDKITDGEYRIVRLLSTDPNDYLNAELSPGSMISLSF